MLLLNEWTAKPGTIHRQVVARSYPSVRASREHFIDLCRMLGQPSPAEHDATGAEFTFEKYVTPTGEASRR